LLELRDWLLAEKVTLVVMEATGVIRGLGGSRPPRKTRDVLSGWRVCRGRVIRSH